MLTRRQINVQRENLASICRISVKSLLDYACLDSHVDDDCEEFINFCAVFEQLVSHRLRPYQKKVWLPGQGSPRHFWDVLLENYNRSRGFLFQNCIPNIEAIETFSSPKAKLRAFIRVALMEKRLSDYMFWLLDNTTLMCESYLDGALLMSEEAAVLCGDLIGLNAIDFNFCLKGNENELLGPLEISYSPFLKYKQPLASQSSDDIEMMHLNGKDTEEDMHPGSILTEQNLNDVLRLQNLEKNISHIKEQKDYLEELVRLQERQIKEANNKIESMKSEQQLAHKDWERECRTMDACVLELQAELSKLQKQNESLKTQVVSLKQFKQRMEMSEVPLVDMAVGEDRELDKPEVLVEMEPVEDRMSVMRTGRKKKSTTTPSDQRSVISFVSDCIPYQEDSHSMIPLIGSLADVSMSVIDSAEKECPREAVTISQVSLHSAENMADEKNIKEVSTDKNVPGQLTEQTLSFQSDTNSTGERLPKADNEYNLTSLEEENKICNLEVHKAAIPPEAEDESQKDYSDGDTAILESYVEMEDVTEQTVILASLQSENLENPGDASGTVVESIHISADSAGLNVEQDSVMRSSGNSSSVESEKEEEGVMSEPEIVNPGNTSSDSSDATWEILSDSGHNESRGEN